VWQNQEGIKDKMFSQQTGIKSGIASAFEYLEKTEVGNDMYRNLCKLGM
jgi:hypothetical protein